jgi:signal transduction histidine kinase/CheY-like chemotaxis protein
VSGLSNKRYLNFQAKVLIPVVTVSILFLGILLWLVSRHLTAQLEEDAKQLLTTSEAVFRDSYEIRTRNLLLRYQNVVNEPRFKAVAQLAEPKTMTMLLTELLNEMGQDTEVLIYTAEGNIFSAAAKRERNLNLQEFRSRSSVSIEDALRNQVGADTIAINQRVFNVISVPVVVNESRAGILTIGIRVGNQAAQEFKLLTRSEIALVVNNVVAVSTLEDQKFYPQLITKFQQLSGLKTTEVITPGGERFLCMVGRFSHSSSNVGYLILSSYEKALHEKKVMQEKLTLLSLVGILLCCLLIWVLIRRITRPLRELRNSVEAVGRGDFSQRIEVHSNDEYGELATVFNQMMENLNASHAEIQRTLERLKSTQDQLLQTEKLSAIGKFVAGVAHELNNPLTGVIGFSEMLQDTGINEHQQNYLNRIIDSAERCHKIVQSLLSFSRRRRVERESININQLIESTIEIFKYELPVSNIEVTLDFASDLPSLLIDPHQIQLVFLNILNNARQAIESQQSSGLIHITTELVEDHVRISFRDNGPGIPSENLSQIFDPFFTTKSVGDGTGLGLSLSYGIIREHDGTITARNNDGKGVTFIIDLPVVSIIEKQEAVKTATAALPEIGQDSGNKILVIDDEENILELIKEALAVYGYKVETVCDGEAALRAVNKDSYDLIICDWKIPGLGGQMIYERLRQMNPQALEKFFFITGDILSENAEKFLRIEKKICLFKPFSVEQFRTTVQEVLHSN